MMRDIRLSRVLHILLHLAEQKGPVTSEVLANMLMTNPVVVRQIMAGLRKQGYVQSEKGHGGGWTLACDMSKVTLCDIYTALGCPPVFAISNRIETPVCLVEQTVNSALGQAFQDAEKLLLSRFNKVSLAMLSTDLHARLVARGSFHNYQEKAHVS
jgi:DNA-binding IscR family transcriptional regulator